MSKKISLSIVILVFALVFTVGLSPIAQAVVEQPENHHYPYCGKFQRKCNRLVWKICESLGGFSHTTPLCQQHDN